MELVTPSRCALAMLITGALSSAAAIAQTPGTLDTGLGIGGRVTTSLGANNDRLLVAGESASGPNIPNTLTVARQLPNGLPDMTFGNGGSGTHDAACAMAVQTDRKILLAGRVSGIAYTDFREDFALARVFGDLDRIVRDGFAGAT